MRRECHQMRKNRFLRGSLKGCFDPKFARFLVSFLWVVNQYVSCPPPTK
jgi:hypothetical protein